MKNKAGYFDSRLSKNRDSILSVDFQNPDLVSGKKNKSVRNPLRFSMNSNNLRSSNQSPNRVILKSKTDEEEEQDRKAKEISMQRFEEFK